MIASFNPNDASTGIVTAVNGVCLNLVWLGLACMVASYMEVAAWMMIGAPAVAISSSSSSSGVNCGGNFRSQHSMTSGSRISLQFLGAGTRISNRLRARYLRSALQQEVCVHLRTCGDPRRLADSASQRAGWLRRMCTCSQVAFYDTEATTGVLLQGLNDDMVCVQTATGEKVLSIGSHMLCIFGSATQLNTALHLRSAPGSSLSELLVLQVGQFIHNMATSVGGFAIGDQLAAAVCIS